MKSFTLNRRKLLRGAGVAMGLPMMEAMLPIGKQAFAQSSQPQRLLIYYVPNGMHMQAWTPKDTGSNYALTPTLAPLRNVKEDLMVISNLSNRPGNQSPGDHAGGTSAFATNTNGDRDTINLGASVDQVYAQRIGNQTKLPSLEMGIDGGKLTGSCDSGLPCAYQRNISWSGPKTPVPKITDPRQIFDRMFAGDNADQSQSEAQKRAALNKPVLDSVLQDIKNLKQQLGQNDRHKLDEYLTNIERIESRLDLPEVVCAAPDRPNDNYDVTNKIHVMSDLMVVAFECDITRSISFMQANGGSGRNYDFIGAQGGHHPISHHKGLQENYDKLMKINKWEIERFAYLLEKLKNTVDATGTPLLQSSMVFLSSEISDGNSHSHDNMPVLLAGHANGKLNTGRHLRYGNRENFGDFYMALLDILGTPVQRFGDEGTKILQGLG